MDMFLPKPGVTTCCTSKGFVIILDTGKWGWWGDGTESSLEHVVDPSRPEVLLRHVRKQELNFYKNIISLPFSFYLICEFVLVLYLYKSYKQSLCLVVHLNNKYGYTYLSSIIIQRTRTLKSVLGESVAFFFF